MGNSARNLRNKRTHESGVWQVLNNRKARSHLVGTRLLACNAECWPLQLLAFRFPQIRDRLPGNVLVFANSTAILKYYYTWKHVRLNWRSFETIVYKRVNVQQCRSEFVQLTETTPELLIRESSYLRYFLKLRIEIMDRRDFDISLMRYAKCKNFGIVLISLSTICKEIRSKTSFLIRSSRKE